MQHKALDQIKLSYWMIDFFNQSGLKHLVVSPGSRSTPFLLAASTHPNIELIVSTDERSAAFMALGMCRVSKQATGLLCTSGTAAAHYLPAFIEADLQSLPLIAFTADRPAHLRGSGANQTIDQTKLFGQFAEFDAFEMHDLSEHEFIMKLNQLSDSYHLNRPLQCNLHFEKPLEGDTSALELLPKPILPFLTRKLPDKTPSIEKLIDEIASAKKPLFIAGPSNETKLFQELFQFIQQHRIPFIAELSSGFYGQLNGAIQANLSTLLLEDENKRSQLKPDLIISCGQSSTTKSVLQYLSELKLVRQIHFNGTLKDLQNPIQKKAITFVKDQVEEGFFSTIDPKIDERWVEKWRLVQYNVKSNEFFSHDLSADQEITEESFYRLFNADYLSKKSHNICLGNSSIPRDIDLFVQEVSEINTSFYSTRAASGIDGLIAQALGTTKIKAQPTTLIIGDVSFQHDLASLDLVSKNHVLPLQIIVLNNQGGKIFDRLPIASYTELLTKFFHTPTSFDISSLCSSFKLPYYRVEMVKDWYSIPDLNQHSGCRVIEVKCDSNSSSLHKAQLRTFRPPHS